MAAEILINDSLDAYAINDKMNENGETELHLAAAQNVNSWVFSEEILKH